MGDSEGPVTWVSVGEERERERQTEREREREREREIRCSDLLLLYDHTPVSLHTTVLLNTSLVYFVYVQTDVEGRG